MLLGRDDMESFRRWLHAAKDPLLVWNFQKTFGVEKVRHCWFSLDRRNRRAMESWTRDLRMCMVLQTTYHSWQKILIKLVIA